MSGLIFTVRVGRLAPEAEWQKNAQGHFCSKFITRGYHIEVSNNAFPVSMTFAWSTEKVTECRNLSCMLD